MRLLAAACDVCGQAVLREERRFEVGVRVVCDDNCKATLRAMDAGVKVELVARTCLSCGEAFLADVSHVGVARRGDSPDICPACWREGLWEARDGDPYLDYLSGLWGAVWALLSSTARSFWAPGLNCPRCGEPAHRTYEWSCRYPLTVGICEGLSGQHVHTVCRRCGYEVVRLETKKPPAGKPARGSSQGLGAMIPKSSPSTAKRPLSTTSLL